MAPIKRYFPIPYLVIASAAIGHVVWQLARTQEAGRASVGALIAIVPLVSFMFSPAVVRRPRTWRNQYVVLALSVEEGQLARRLGIEHVGGVPFLMGPLGYDADSVLPTVIIADPNRRIIVADSTDDYRVRPEPSTFLAALDAEA